MCATCSVEFILANYYSNSRKFLQWNCQPTLATDFMWQIHTHTFTAVSCLGFLVNSYDYFLLRFQAYKLPSLALDYHCLTQLDYTQSINMPILAIQIIPVYMHWR